MLVETMQYIYSHIRQGKASNVADTRPLEDVSIDRFNSSVKFVAIIVLSYSMVGREWVNYTRELSSNFAANFHQTSSFPLDITIPSLVLSNDSRIRLLSESLIF